MHNIILVDDEIGILKSLRRLFKNAPCVVNQTVFNLQIEIFDTPFKALDYLENNEVDLIISDYKMPHMDGVTFLNKSKQLQPDAARIILSGYSDLNAILRAVNDVGIARFLAKPWNDYELITDVAQVLATRDILLDNRRLAELLKSKSLYRENESGSLLRMELSEPGLTHLNWGPNGEVILDSTE